MNQLRDRSRMLLDQMSPGWFALVMSRGIVSRRGLLWFAMREAGWDRNRRGAALSELANEATWLLVTLAWLVKCAGQLERPGFLVKPGQQRLFG